MREDFHSQLSKEITRKQFLQYVAGAVLVVFGFDNLMRLLTGSNRHTHGVLSNPDGRHGFGSRKFGA
ncbi:MAG: hypothetical protein WC498_03385 [Candidatus Saccharimonadales bacterium]